MTRQEKLTQKFYSVQEAARVLGVSWQRVYQYVSEGRLRRRRRYVVTGRSVEALLKARKPGRKP